MKTFALLKPDGKTITATAFEPSSPKGRTLLMSAATGMKQTFYYKFAEYYAEQGYHVYTYDYSGIGLSGGDKVRSSGASYSTWGKEDFPIMVRHLKQKHSDQPLYYIGHSFGGNCLGMSDVSKDLEAIITVASQHGYWGGFEGINKYKVWAVFAISMPLLTRLLGYFPSKTHSLGENLPRGVANDWSDVILNYHGMEVIGRGSWNRALGAPMLCMSFTDDSFAPKQAVDRLAFESYAETPLERLHIAPEDWKADSIGHFDFFRKKFRDSLWQIPLEWFDKQAEKQGAKQAVKQVPVNQTETTVS